MSKTATKTSPEEPDQIAELVPEGPSCAPEPNRRDDDDRDTLVSNSLPGVDQPPLVIELCVELPESNAIADPAEQVIEALSRSLLSLGWRPTVVSARRPGREGP